jgi:hypothetical protein
MNWSEYLKPNEEVIESIDGTMQYSGKGTVLLTNKRLLYFKKTGVFSEKTELFISVSLGDVREVLLLGIVKKVINIKTEQKNRIITYTCQCKEPETFMQRIKGATKEYKEDQTIDAKQVVIIEQGKKDSAAEILKKRLARGEITKEEFHDKIQRT